MLLQWISYFLAYFLYFEINKRRLMGLPCCLRVYVSVCVFPQVLKAGIVDPEERAVTI
jgi:hypothetical protein